MDRAIRIGKYLARRALGAGSFATVWLAYDELLDAQVAVKVLADNWAQNPDVRRRFIDEAKLLRRIDHDRIVRVHDVDELPDGRPYFVMTWADRGTLHDRLAEHRRTDRPMDVETAARLAIEVCECLAVVHDFGAVHRDVKPSNVLFRSVRSHERAAAQRRGGDLGDEQMVLGDFGLAKDLAAASGFTQAAGTPAYMAPEQARPTAIIDRRVDVFGASAVLYEMLTGRPAIAASTLSGVRRGTDGSGIQPVRALRPDVPAPLAAVVGRGLAFDPEQRYASAPDFADALAASIAHAPRTTPAPARVPSVPPAPSGVAGRAHDLLALARRHGLAPAETLDAIEARLGGPLRVVEWRALADGDDPARFGGLTLPAACALVRTTVVERVDGADVIVVASAGSTDGTAALRERLLRAVAGPVAVVALAADPDAAAADPNVRALTVDVVRDDAEGHRTVVELCAALTDRLSPVRASAALAELDAVVAAATAQQWPAAHDLGDRIEALRLELPILGELDTLRADAAGRSALPVPLRRELRRLLVWSAPARRLALPDDAGGLRAAAQSSLERWRTLGNTGRIPFSARATAELVERSLERLWVELEA